MTGEIKSWDEPQGVCGGWKQEQELGKEEARRGQHHSGPEAWSMCKSKAGEGSNHLEEIVCNLVNLETK